MQINFIPYNSSFKNVAIEIFQSNCPKYFDEDDLPLFTDFLDNYSDENYKMVEFGGIIIGCGGHYVKHETQNFGIAWVMFKRFVIGAKAFKEISALFYNEIIDAIKKENLPYDIVINTTQLMERLFKAYGFLTDHIEPDGFGPGLDHVVMKKILFPY